MVDFASNPNFIAPVTAPYLGQPTKVAMTGAQRANGFVPGQPVAVEHVNHELNTITANIAALQGVDVGINANLAQLNLEKRRTFAARCRPRVVDLDGVTPTATNAFIGACSSGRNVLVAKGDTNGVFFFGGEAIALSSGITPATLTDCRKLVRGTTRLLAIGAGGNRNAFSTTGGASWTAGGSSTLAADPTDCVWNGTRFVIMSGGGDSASSPDGTTWTNAGGVNDIANVIAGAGQFGGLAVLAGGKIVATGNSPTTMFAQSTNNGTSWATTGGNVPSSGDYVATGWLAGNGGSEIYWVGHPTADDLRLDFLVSSDGTTWTKRSEVPTESQQFNAVPKLLMCQDTGLLVAIATLSVGTSISVSDDLGFTWSEPFAFRATRDAIAVANGRIFTTVGAKIFGSDGSRI